jgi:hypothetical protein
MTDEEQMALCAIRYIMPRMSYIVPTGLRWARKYGTQSAQVRSILIQDIREAHKHVYGLGMNTDRAAWLAVLAELEAMP